jgi:hypothetical protein
MMIDFIEEELSYRSPDEIRNGILKAGSVFTWNTIKFRLISRNRGILYITLDLDAEIVKVYLLLETEFITNFKNGNIKLDYEEENDCNFAFSVFDEELDCFTSNIIEYDNKQRTVIGFDGDDVYHIDIEGNLNFTPCKDFLKHSKAIDYSKGTAGIYLLNPLDSEEEERVVFHYVDNGNVYFFRQDKDNFLVRPNLRDDPPDVYFVSPCSSYTAREIIRAVKNLYFNPYDNRFKYLLKNEEKPYYPPVQLLTVNDLEEELKATGIFLPVETKAIYTALLSNGIRIQFNGKDFNIMDIRRKIVLSYDFTERLEKSFKDFINRNFSRPQETLINNNKSVNETEEIRPSNERRSSLLNRNKG